MQFIFAGKAHPADNEGKELIKTIVNFARDPAVRRRVVFIENYDINVARYLVQGVDVWLNTPRRPYEASGTSGMKAAANGVLNCSILDGWWVEGYSPDVGWAIGRGEMYGDPRYRTLESQALYDLLEKQIVPLFYDRTRQPAARMGRADEGVHAEADAGVQHQSHGAGSMQNSFISLPSSAGRCWQTINSAALSSSRMPRITLRAEMARRQRRRRANQRQRTLQSRRNDEVDAMLDLPGIDPKLVNVQMFYGPINASGEIDNPQVLHMDHMRADLQ